MPELWQRELEKLRHIEASATLRRRLSEEPRGEGVPPAPRRGQRIAAGVVAFAVFGGAIALAWGAFGRQSSPVAGIAGNGAVTIELRGGVRPTAHLRFGDATVEPQVGSYCWTSQSSGVCVDTVVRAFAPDEFVSIPTGTSIVVDSDTDHVDLASLPGNDPIADVPMRPLGDTFDEGGRIVVTATASWPQGDVQFFFAVDVVSPDTAPAIPDVLIATLEAPSDGSVPGLTLTYGDTSKDFFAQGGAWPGFEGYDGPRQVFPVAVAPGTSLRIEGNAHNWVVDIKLGGAADSRDFGPNDGLAMPLEEPGDYLVTFKGVWAEGTVAFPVEVMVRDVAVSASPNEPSTPSPAATLPDLVGMTDQEAMLGLDALGLTWVVAYRAVDGDLWQVVEMDPPAGSSVTIGGAVHLIVATEITPLPAGAEDALVCPSAEHVVIGGPSMFIEPGGEAYIRGNTTGVRLRDEIVQVTFTDQEWHGLWHVIRDGEVVAVVDWDTLDGVACAGSGVGAA
jgi:hypothetical protein